MVPFTYFIGYKDAKRIRPLYIFLPKRSAYKRDFDKTKYMHFLIKNDELLEKCYEIWRKVKMLFDIETVYNKKDLKLK